MYLIIYTYYILTTNLYGNLTLTKIIVLNGIFLRLNGRERWFFIGDFVPVLFINYCNY